jgi:ubiquinol-cytochrome c reductase subunit 6
MGITDFFTDLMASVSFPEAHAEAPAEEEDKAEGGDGGEEDKSEGSDGEKEEEGSEAEGEEEASAEAEEEAEEEDDEPVDIKPKLEAGQSIHPSSSNCFESPPAAPQAA